MALVLAAVLLAGCSAFGPPDAQRLEDAPVDLQPAARGQVVEVSHGESAGTSWRVVAYLEEGGDLCLAEIVSEAFSGSACGPAGIEEDGIGLVTATPFIGNDGFLISAVLRPDARALGVDAETGGAQVPVVSLEPIGVDAVAGALLLRPGLTPSTVTAVDARGAAMGRRGLGPGF